MKTQATYTIRKATLMVLVVFMTITSSLADHSGPSKNNRQRANTPSAFTAASYQISASGHEVSYGFNLAVGTTNRLLEAGSMFTHDQKFAGFSAKYREVLNPKNANTSVYAHINANYFMNQGLDHQLSAKIYNVEMPELSNTFNTTEAFVGFGIQQRLIAQLYVDASIGVGAYTRSIQESTDYRCKDFARYSDDKGVSLNLNFSIVYKLW
ncbi:MAG: hypothetical protein RIS47_736 [Bacteroidota bacterium]|jgi:hypothetical protein